MYSKKYGQKIWSPQHAQRLARRNKRMQTNYTLYISILIACYLLAAALDHMSVVKGAF